MRTIKFKAKRVDNKQWVYGDLLRDGRITFIRWMHNPTTKDFTDVVVYQDTVCQFTGLQDKNGKDIYEGDVYKVNGSKGYNIKFKSGSFAGGKKLYSALGWKYNPTEDDTTESDFHSIIEITGNIHD